MEINAIFRQAGSVLTKRPNVVDTCAEGNMVSLVHIRNVAELVIFAFWRELVAGQDAHSRFMCDVPTRVCDMFNGRSPQLSRSGS